MARGACREACFPFPPTPPLTHTPQFNKALREVSRIIASDNLTPAWRRGAVFTRPAIARVEAAKAGVARRERAEFKRSMRWVMARRARGF